MARGQCFLYDVQKRVGDEWRSVFYGDPGLRTPVGLPVDPGESIVWVLRLSAAALSRRDWGTLMVCEPIDPGRYRFVYHGVGEGDIDGVGTEFEVVSEHA